MKKRILWMIVFLFCLVCPVHTKAAETTATSKVNFEVDAQNITNPVTIKTGKGSSISSAKSTGAGISTASASATTKQINVIYNGLKSYKTTINVKGYRINSSNFATILSKALDKDYYLLDAIVQIKPTSWAYQDTRTGYYTSIHLNYLYSKSTMKKRYSGLKSVVSSAKKSFGSNLTKEQAALAAHDYIIKRASYDMAYYKKAMANPGYTNWNSHSAYGILLNKKGVCSGYAYAYRLFMKAYNIPCVFVESDSMDHAWNMIQLGGKWYHVDATWDDPDASLDWTKSGSGSLIYYDFFLLNNSEMIAEKHYGWYPYYSCTSTTYSKMPRHSSYYQQHSGAYWYYVKQSGTNYLYTRTSLKGTGETALVTSTSPLIRYNKRVYYVKNQTTLASMNINGTFKRTLNSLTGLPAGTRYTLQSISNSTLTFFYVLPNNAGTGTKSIVLSDYEQRTTNRATSLTLSATKKTLKRKQTYVLKATVGPTWAVNKKVTYKSSNTKVATVGKKGGRITAKAKGSATITVSVEGSSIKKTCKVTVK